MASGIPISGGSFTGNVVAYSTNRSGANLRNIEIRTTSATGTLQSTNKIIMVRNGGVYDNNGTTSTQIARVYDNNGTTSTQIARVYDNNGVESSLIYSAESDVITLTGTVTQGTTMQWKDVDYKITEDWTTMTIVGSSWGKSYGEFETAIQLIEGSTKTTLVDRKGEYGGYPMDAEPIVASGTQYTVKKGQTIRLAVGASYNPNVSGQHQTTSWVSFILS